MRPESFLDTRNTSNKRIKWHDFLKIILRFIFMNVCICAWSLWSEQVARSPELELQVVVSHTRARTQLRSSARATHTLSSCVFYFMCVASSPACQCTSVHGWYPGKPEECTGSSGQKHRKLEHQAMQLCELPNPLEPNENSENLKELKAAKEKVIL